MAELAEDFFETLEPLQGSWKMQDLSSPDESLCITSLVPRVSGDSSAELLLNIPKGRNAQNDETYIERLNSGKFWDRFPAGTEMYIRRNGVSVSLMFTNEGIVATNYFSPGHISRISPETLIEFLGDADMQFEAIAYAMNAINEMRAETENTNEIRIAKAKKEIMRDLARLWANPDVVDSGESSEVEYYSYVSRGATLSITPPGNFAGKDFRFISPFPRGTKIIPRTYYWQKTGNSESAVPLFETLLEVDDNQRLKIQYVFSKLQGSNYSLDRTYKGNGRWTTYNKEDGFIRTDVNPNDEPLIWEETAAAINHIVYKALSEKQLL